MIVFSSTLISIILYVVYRNKSSDHAHIEANGRSHNDNHYSPASLNRTEMMLENHTDHSLASQSWTAEKLAPGIVILDIANLCLLALSLFATLWSLIKIRTLNYRRSMTRKLKSR